MRAGKALKGKVGFVEGQELDQINSVRPVYFGEGKSSRNELSSERQYTAVFEGRVVRRGPRVVLVDSRFDPRLMSGLGSENRSGGTMKQLGLGRPGREAHEHSRQVSRSGDVGGCTKVGRYTDVFKDGSDCERASVIYRGRIPPALKALTSCKGHWVGVRERVFARLGSLVPKSSAQERDV